MKFREYINENRSQFCTGCGACMASCPTGALRIVQDVYGYYVSEFDAAMCVGCDKCDDICPILSPKDYPMRDKTPDSFAVQMCDDIRMQCSSGGFFLAAAKEIIEKKNGVVYGAAWEDDVLYHRAAETEEELKGLCGSKYVQCNTSDAYPRIKELLKKKRCVLFCGCPCQVAGLYSFLGMDYEGLYTIDLLCYYAPSIRMFQDYLKENYHGAAKKWNFRDKRLGWSCENLTLEIEAGVEQKEVESVETRAGRTKKYIVCPRETDIYEQAYHSHLMMSVHCQNCKFNKMPRQGDITIGDLWGVERFDKDLMDEKGTSIVIINSVKGKELLLHCEDKIGKIKQASLKWIEGNRINEAAAVERSNECKRFYDMYRLTGEYTKSASYSLNNKHDVAVVGCWDIKNYGSQLTYYALYYVLNKMGYSALLIGCHKNARYKSTSAPDLFRNNPYPSLDLSRQFNDKIDMIEANAMADMFVVGSDQVWNNSLYKHFGEFTLLDFVFSNKKKVSYAASFGGNYWKGSEVEKTYFQYCLQRFNKISVRETSGVDVCSTEFSQHAEWVIDPVFLLGADALAELANGSNVKRQDKYVFAYLLDYSDEKYNLLTLLCTMLNCESVIVTDPNHAVEPAWKDHAHTDYCLEDWLWLFKNAEYVLTDSFHASVFSFIFDRPFWIYDRVNGEEMNSRLDTFLQKFDLTRKKKTCVDEADDFEADYKTGKMLLCHEQEKVYAFLHKSMKNIRK